MRILQVCNKVPYPPKEGGAIAMFSFLKGFYLAGHSVTLAAINTSKHYTDLKSIPEDVSKMADFHDIFIDTKLKPIPALFNLLFSNKPYTATRFISYKFEDKLIETLKNQEFDVIQLEGLYVCPYIETIRKHSKALISYRAHNIEFEIWDRLWRETKSPFKRLYLKNLTKRIKRFETSFLNTYDAIIPITQRDADSLNSLGNTKPTFVAPTGIFTDSNLEYTPAKEPFTIFHIGVLDWAPNTQGILWFLENCWDELRKIHPNITFQIAGRNAPDWFIKQVNIPGVEFLGEVESAEDFMRENGIMIVPLLAGSGMRIKIVEGLSHGKVIVSTSIGAEGIPAKNNEEICIADSADEFIAAIDNLLKNKEQLHNIEKNAIEFVKNKLSNNTIIQQLINFYSKHV